MAIGIGTLLSIASSAHNLVGTSISFFWTRDYQIVASMTTHVDDLVPAAKQPWLDTTKQLFEERFGDMKPQRLPSTHRNAM